MADELQVRGRIQAILADAEDPDAVKAEALRRVHGVDEDWKPGESPPASDLNSRWRRAIAQNPAGVLGALQRRHPPASAKVFGNQKEYELVLPEDAGRLIVKWIPSHG